MIDIFIEKGKEILCVRFVNVGVFNCINEHIQLIEKMGFVWFGKIGTKPTTKALDKMIEDKPSYILLKDPQNAYICEFDIYNEVKPYEREFPDYYTTEILPTRNFSIWFRLTSIKKIDDLKSLNDVVLKSSRNPILDTARKSMASYFYTVSRKDITL